MSKSTKSNFHSTFHMILFITCQMLKPNLETMQQSRQLWMWTQGFIQIILCYHFRKDSRNSKLKSILEVSDTTPDNYLFDRYNQPNAVYLKPGMPQLQEDDMPELLPPELMDHFYLGSTITNMLSREANRVSKYRQLLQLTHTKCELAVRWWYHYRNYHWFSTIVLSIQPTKTKARAMEHTLIGHYKSSLNYPFIGHHLVQKASGFKSNVVLKQHGYDHDTRRNRPNDNYSLRWIFRLRARHHHQLPVLDTFKYYQILFGLAADTRESWDTQRALRSTIYTSDELFLLWRMHKRIEQPHQSTITGHLKTIFQFRKLITPKSNLSLQLPPLCHTTFFKEASKVLRRHILQHKSSLLPFHIPTHQIQEASNPKILHLLYNYGTWDTNFSLQTPTTCPCQAYLTKQPHLNTINGHIVTSMCQFQLPLELRTMAGARANSKYYLSKSRYFKSATQILRKWCIHHNLPYADIEEPWTKMLEDQWKLHYQALNSTKPTPFQLHQLQTLRREFRKFVVHGEDHKPFKIMVYCPIHYHRATQTTWNDPKTFAIYHLSPTQFYAEAPNMIPNQIRKHYKWGIQDTAPVPTGMVLLKSSKRYLKGRTVLNYKGNIISKLLQATTIALNHIINTLFPDVPGNHDMPTVFKQLHSFLDQLPAHDPLDSTTHYLPLNDDLVGFFNSIPQEDILKFAKQLLDMYSDHVQKPTDQIVFTVDLHQPTINRNNCTSSQINFNPKSKHNVQYHKHIHLKHVLDIIQLSITLGVVSVQGTCYKQILGSTIGNQISPTVCSIPILFREKEWREKHPEWLIQHGKSMWYDRYVDNRFAIIPRTIFNSDPLTEFTDEWFYRKPIQLETVPDTHFLGTNVDINQRQINFILPTDKWQIQPINSAASTSKLLSSFRTRLFLITHNTYPSSNCAMPTIRLIQLYKAQGYSETTLRNIAKSHFRTKQIPNAHLLDKISHQISRLPVAISAQ